MRLWLLLAGLLVLGIAPGVAADPPLDETAPEAALVPLDHPGHDDDRGTPGPATALAGLALLGAAAVLGRQR